MTWSAFAHNIGPFDGYFFEKTSNQQKKYGFGEKLVPFGHFSNEMWIFDKGTNFYAFGLYINESNISTAELAGM